MLNLKNIDLIAISSDKPVETIKSINYSSQGIEFGSIKFITHIKKEDLFDTNTDNIEFLKIEEITSHQEYNDFCLTLKKYTSNDFILLIQND